MKKGSKKYIACGFMIVFMIISFIWIQSCFSVSISSAESKFVLNIVKDIARPIFGDIDLGAHSIRKLAHAIEYFILGFICACIFVNFSAVEILVSIKSEWISFICKCVISIGIVFIVAFIDEFIQIFSGRGSRFSDVLLDFVSGLIAIVFISAIKIIIHIVQRLVK